MTELLKAVTRLANVAADYLEKQGNPAREVPSIREEMTTPVVAKLRGRPKKQEPQEPREPAPAEGVSESDSAALLNAAATEYVKRASNRDTGVAEIRKLLNDEFKVTRLTDLVHAQRLQLISKLSANGVGIL